MGLQGKCKNHRPLVAGLRLPAHTCAGARQADCGCLDPTPMHSSQLCVAATARMAVRSVVGRAGARCALHSYGVFRNLIISSPARKRLSLMSAAHIAGGVAATEQALAVCRNMPFQMSTAARADRGFGSRRKGGSDGSLQVVEPPVNLGRKTMCSCSRPSAQPPRVIADQMPSRRLRLNIVESYA